MLKLLKQYMTLKKAQHKLEQNCKLEHNHLKVIKHYIDSWLWIHSKNQTQQLSETVTQTLLEFSEQIDLCEKRLNQFETQYYNKSPLSQQQQFLKFTQYEFLKLQEQWLYIQNNYAAEITQLLTQKETTS